jgi:hypothetical protein
MKMENVAAAEIKVVGSKNETDKNKESKMENLKTVWSEACAQKNERAKILSGLLKGYKTISAKISDIIEAKIQVDYYPKGANDQYLLNMSLEEEKRRLKATEKAIAKITDAETEATRYYKEICREQAVSRNKEFGTKIWK